MIFVEFAEELTQKSQYSFHWRHGHRKVQFFNRAEKTSSAHTAPKMSVGSSSKSTANEGNLSLFSCLRSRKFTVPAGKQNNNCKDQWTGFCSRSFGGRPVTVPEWRSTHSKESTTSVAKTTAFFLLCFRAYANTHVMSSIMGQ